LRAKACIHPAQIAVVRKAFAPTPEQIEWAPRVPAAEATAAHGVFTHRGRMIDGPLLAQVRLIMDKEAS
jgi:citrate lyase subunit beta/citryl-CoA lyase